MSPLKWWRVCRTCNTYYREIDNIGTWNCAYHPGLYNAEVDGPKFPKYSYECCGVSDTAYRDDGSKNPYFNPSFLHGCTNKDHSSTVLNFDSTNVKMTEDEFPKVLLKELKHDIRALTTYNGISYEKTKNQLIFKHKGLCIDANTGFLYIMRKDQENELHRSRNKVYLNKNLTKYITFVIDECRVNGNICIRDSRSEQQIKIDDKTNIKELLNNIIKTSDWYFSEEITLPQTETVVKNSLKRLPDYTGKKIRYNNALPFYYIIRVTG
tara:strand:- start:6288 stop:7088 length:801 start_codon:yes stop_codon:yes gene_type:complete